MKARKEKLGSQTERGRARPFRTKQWVRKKKAKSIVNELM